MTFDVPAIANLQTELTALWHEQTPASAGEGFFRLVQENHLRNFQLWHEEDIARRDDIGFERIYHAKRAIDRYNQERNNFIEEMDKALVAELHPAESGCPRNSETPGMIIDRLSIMALKEFHMREETEREDASDEHKANCAAKLARLLHQRGDLIECLDELLEAVKAKTRTFAVYYQFKMYNDPTLNPQLYAGKKPACA
ncbi:MAG: DUF4254 domain-containing protein [Luteolibacter sp.]